MNKLYLLMFSGALAAQSVAPAPVIPSDMVIEYQSSVIELQAAQIKVAEAQAMVSASIARMQAVCSAAGAKAGLDPHGKPACIQATKEKPDGKN